MRVVYMDYAASTPVRPEVAEAMNQAMLETWGNPSSPHRFGREARKLVDDARRKVADLVGAAPREVVFTSGGTEADNLAIAGTLLARRDRGRHLVTSAVEHHAVLGTCEYLARAGLAEVTILPVDAYGRVDPDTLAAAVRPDTVLVSVMLANNEVGTIQPIAELARVCREREVPFHTDAVQAVGTIPVNVRELGVDLLSLAAHKFYGPQGAGALVVRRGHRLEPLLHGGSHERQRRAGTEGVPAIVGLGKAAELAAVELEAYGAHARAMRDRLLDGVFGRIADVRLNGHPTSRLPNHAHLSFRGVDGEALLLKLDLLGIACSAGSACAAGAPEPSHVLRALGVEPEWAGGSVRLTVGRPTTAEDVDYVVDCLADTVARLRGGLPAAAGRVRP